MIGRLLSALTFHVRKSEREWRAENRLRREMRYGWIRRLIVAGSARPLRSSALLLSIFAIITTVATFGPFPGFPRLAITFNEDNALTYFSILWSIQAIIVALIYPIVIAFVTLLVQQLHRGKSILHIYMQDTAAKLAGSSALMLLALMSFQYLLAAWTNVDTILNWTFVAGYWFLINLGLTGFFLYRTFEYLSPARRTETVNRFAVNVAWPAEVRSHLKAHIFDNAVRHKVLPGPAYLSESDEIGGRVWTGLSGRMATHAVPIVERQLGLQMAIVDVLFRPLAWATRRWLSRAAMTAEQQPEQDESSWAGLGSEGLVLLYPIQVNELYRDKSVLCSRIGEVSLKRVERAVVRFAFRFGRARRELDLTTIDLFDDIRGSALDAIQSGETKVFSELVREIEALFVLLVEASCFTNDDGKADNFAQLTDQQHVFGRPIYERWARAIMDLFAQAANKVSVEDEYLRQLIYVSPRIFQSLDRSATPTILIFLLELPPILFRRLGDWWARVVEQQGDTGHGRFNPAVVRPPFSGVYESLLKHHVSAWERFKNELFPPGHKDLVKWPRYQVIGTLFERHLHITASMISECVDRGDRTGAIWSADMLLKWYSELEYRFDRHLHFIRQDRWVTYEFLTRDWTEAQTSLETVHGAFGEEDAQKNLFSIVLSNYWEDVCCVLSYSLATWGRSSGAGESVPALVLGTIVHGRSLVGGAHSAQARAPFASADDLLICSLRQRFVDSSYRSGYRARLDFLVERLSNIAAEVMVPGRVYGGFGAQDLDSLRAGQLSLFLLMARDSWRPYARVEELLQTWLRNEDETLREFADELDAWIMILEDDSFRDFTDLFNAVNEKPDWTFDQALTCVRNGFDALRQQIAEMRLKAIEQADISEARLIDVSKWASESGFRQETGAFPLQLFRQVNASAEEFEARSLVLQKVAKGEYTEPLMAPRPMNNAEWFDHTIRDHVGAFLLRDSIIKMTVEDLDAGSPELYWEHVKAYARRAVNDGRSPILLVENRTRPDWAYEWSHQIGDRGDIPPDLNVWRDDKIRSDAYICHFNEVAVYFGTAIPYGRSILITSESFRSVTFTRFATGYPVVAEAEDVQDEPLQINLLLTWRTEIIADDYPGIRLIYDDEE